MDGDEQVADKFDIAVGDREDAILARYELSLAHQQSNIIGGPGEQYVLAMDMDSMGGLYLAGRFSKELHLPLDIGSDFPSAYDYYQPGNSIYSGFVAFYNSDGDLGMKAIFDSEFDSGFVTVDAIKVMPDGSSFVVGGRHNGKPMFGGGCSDKLQDQGFLAHFTGGTQDWIKCFQPPKDSDGSSRSTHVALLLDGSVVAQGQINGEIELDMVVGEPSHVKSAADGADDIFIAAWDGAGLFQGGLVRGSMFNDRALALAAGTGGRIYTSMARDSATPAEALGHLAAFHPPVSQPDWIFERTLAGARIVDIAEDDCGDVIGVGDMRGFATMWDNGVEFSADTAQADYDAIAFKINASGLPLWGRRFGSPNRDQALAVTVGPGRSIFVGGRYDGALQLSPGIQWPAPIYEDDCDGAQDDGFLLHLSP